VISRSVMQCGAGRVIASGPVLFSGLAQRVATVAPG